MNYLLLIIKQLVIWTLPFIGLNFYLSANYNQSLYQVLLWWTDHFSLNFNSVVKLIPFIVLFLLFSIQFNSLVNSLYLGLFGKKRLQVFLGYIAKNKAMYYRANDKTKKVFSEQNYDNEYNYSFHDVNRLKTFIKEPFTKDIKVTLKSHFHPYSILTRSLLSVFLLMPVLASIHALALPAYVPDVNSGVVLKGSAIASFDQVLSNFNLNIFYMALIFFLSLSLAIYFSNRQNQEDLGAEVVSLPDNIKPKNIITGKPLIITKITIEKYDDLAKLNSHVDTGFRRVSFEFSKEFNPPVFVTLKFDSNKYPELEKQIKSVIKAGQTMDLKLTGKLRLKMIEEEAEIEAEMEKKSA
jgi:hypothetical protein